MVIIAGSQRKDAVGNQDIEIFGVKEAYEDRFPFCTIIRFGLQNDILIIKGFEGAGCRSY